MERRSGHGRTLPLRLRKAAGGRGAWQSPRSLDYTSPFPQPAPARAGGATASLPDLMPLPSAFLDELRARIPLPAVIGRRVRLSAPGRQWKGCCPFHGEKTPSFYVYDDHYHCFGCGAHGDAISFVMQSQGAGFIEAVEQLAAEAGLDVPKPSPEAAEAGTPPPRPGRRAGRAQAAFSAACSFPKAAAAWNTCSAAA